MLNNNLLDDFARNFLGYGNLSAPIWFVGMEEGGGNTKPEIAARLDQWVAHDRAPVVDIRSFGDDPELADHARWFAGEKPPLQSTWKQLIRIQLARQSRPSMIDDVRRYQRDELGAADGADCLLELLPLPSPGVADWHYPDWSDLEWLATRDTYREHLLLRRIEAIRGLLTDHKPEFVVFYGISYLDHWSAITGFCFPDSTGYTPRIEADHTTFVVAPHPAAFGAKNTLFARIGQSLQVP